MNEYKKPVGPYIGRGPESDRLYALEAKRNEAIDRAAMELAKFMGIDIKSKANIQFWAHVVPEELLNILESYDSKASKLAATAYLEKRGHVVIDPVAVKRVNSLVQDLEKDAVQAEGLNLVQDAERARGKSEAYRDILSVLNAEPGQEGEVE